VLELELDELELESIELLVEELELELESIDELDELSIDVDDEVLEEDDDELLDSIHWALTTLSADTPSGPVISIFPLYSVEEEGGVRKISILAASRAEPEHK